MSSVDLPWAEATRINGVRSCSSRTFGFAPTASSDRTCATSPSNAAWQSGSFGPLSCANTVNANSAIHRVIANPLSVGPRRAFIHELRFLILGPQIKIQDELSGTGRLIALPL